MYIHVNIVDCLVQKNDRPVYQLVKYMVDVAMGMDYLSEKCYVHRVSADFFYDIITTFTLQVKG